MKTTLLPDVTPAQILAWKRTHLKYLMQQSDAKKAGSAELRKADTLLSTRLMTMPEEEVDRLIAEYKAMIDSTAKAA